MSENKITVIEGDYDEETGSFVKIHVNGEPLNYAGGSSAMLALAILLNHGLTSDQAIALHHRFKSVVLSPLPYDAFRVEVDIDAFVKEHSVTTAMPTPRESER